MNKKIFLGLSLNFFICSMTFATEQFQDFRTPNTNPYVRYEFKTAEQWLEHDKEKKLQELISAQQQKTTIKTDQSLGSYFVNTIPNPIKSGSIKGKYKYLMANSDKLNGCWDKAAQTYGVDPWLLMAIAKTESSFNSSAINVNTNKSVDMGMMQINSIWLPTLRRFGIHQTHLFDPCTSIFVGAWILAQNIKNFGYNQDGIGAYNSPKNIVIRRNYAQKVYSSYRQIVYDLYVAK